MVEEKRQKTKQQQQTLSEKKEEAGTISEQRDKGWIHVIHVCNTTHLTVSVITLRGSRHSQTTPHKERLSGLAKHRDYPPSQLVHCK